MGFDMEPLVAMCQITSGVMPLVIRPSTLLVIRHGPQASRPVTGSAPPTGLRVLRGVQTVAVTRDGPSHGVTAAGPGPGSRSHWVTSRRSTAPGPGGQRSQSRHGPGVLPSLTRSRSSSPPDRPGMMAGDDDVAAGVTHRDGGRGRPGRGPCPFRVRPGVTVRRQSRVLLATPNCVCLIVSVGSSFFDYRDSSPALILRTPSRS